MSDSVGKAYVDSMVSTTTTGITLNTAGVIVSSGSSFNVNLLSPDEIVELRTLEKEYEAVAKNKRINIFKGMPANLRQSIVDHLVCKKFLNDMKHLPEDESEWSRLYDLRRRDSRIHVTSGLSFSSSSIFIGSNYEAFLEFLTEEEMLNAHAEQSLEESLLNAKTN
jgi:hypothetical protein